MHTKDLVIVPINNNENFTSAGGTHWSTLVYHKKQDRFYAFDSVGQANKAASAKVAQKLVCLVGSSIPKAAIQYIKTPQQVNSSDCGIYALSVAEIAAQHSDILIPDAVLGIKKGPTIADELKKHITPQSMTHKRLEIADLINKLTEK